MEMSDGFESDFKNKKKIPLVSNLTYKNNNFYI